MPLLLRDRVPLEVKDGECVALRDAAGESEPLAQREGRAEALPVVVAERDRVGDTEVLAQPLRDGAPVAA